uniref:Molybdopterin synthase catalytic subunit n=1 Tax=Xenopsylla cheopis TaxID=163159 RepID=A0A6M2DPS9_XENCH
MNFIKLTYETLDVQSISEQVTHNCCGAVSMFIGTTRDNFDGKQVLKLEYEAYEPMALTAIQKICLEIREHWPDVQNIAIYHRLGPVGIREASIVVALSSPHRSEAIEATKFAMDKIKAVVPIWKKEFYVEDDVPEWKENTECKWRTGESNILSDY